MLPKNERLARREFSVFFASGRRYHSPHLTVIHSPTPHFKASVVVPKKVARLAILRHRMRRQLYEILRALERDTKEFPRGVYIVIAKKGAQACSYHALTEELIDVVKRIRK